MFPHRYFSVGYFGAWYFGPSVTQGFAAHTVRGMVYAQNIRGEVIA